MQRAVLAEVVRRGLEARLSPAQARHEHRCLEAFFWGVQGEDHPLVDQLLQMGRMTRLVPEPKRVPGGKPLPTWHPAYKP